MSALGVVETIGVDTSFSSDRVRPAVPGAGRASSGATPRRAPLAALTERVPGLIEAALANTLQTARRGAETVDSSTSLAALAFAMEASGDRSGAVANAKEVLARCESLSTSRASDPFAARLAVEVLLRSGELEEVLGHAQSLPLSGHLLLEIGAALAGKERYDEACKFIDKSKVPERDAVRGYVLALQGKYQSAVQPLREALRNDPHDVDSALNLSISLWGIGARRKAMQAAEQARQAGPGRSDVWLHLLELILAEGDINRADREIQTLLSRGVESSARLLILRARVGLAKKNLAPAMRILEQASVKAGEEGDPDTIAEVRSNLVRLRAAHGKLAREIAVEQLLALHREFPTNDVVVVNLAQVVWRREHSRLLRAAFDSVMGSVSPANAAFLQYQIATLAGDNPKAAEHATEWLRLDPGNAQAFPAALIALGIGEERWDEASRLARRALAEGEWDSGSLNNAAYVFAMAGFGEEAVELLTPHGDESFILKATLGLAHLAAGHIELGMKLYRQAADAAEKRHDDSRSLMTAYQALVVRQLGLLNGDDLDMVKAISLPPYPLPDDWEDRPEFLRLHAVAQKRGYGWPLEI